MPESRYHYRNIDIDGERRQADAYQAELSDLRELLTPAAVGHDRAVEFGHDVVDGLGLLAKVRRGEWVVLEARRA